MLPIWIDMRILHTCEAGPFEKAIDDKMTDKVMND